MIKIGKNPCFLFFPGDWTRDLDDHSLEIEGAWIRICCRLWWAPQKGTLTLTIKRWSWILRTNEKRTYKILDYLITQKIADGQEEIDGSVTISSKRMIRDEFEKIGNRQRQAKFREKGGGSPDNWTAIRIKILQIDNYMCAYCGRKANTVDHIIPQSEGGSEEETNLVACCKRCNMKKSNRFPEQANMQFWKGFQRITSYKHQYNTQRNSDVTPASSVSVSVSDSDTNIIKKINKRKCLFDLPEGLKKETWDAFVEVRKTMKAPLTRHASTLVISRLKKLSGNNGEIMELILQQSIVNGYRGVFPLKEEYGKQGDGYIIPEYKSEEMPLTTDTERERGKKILKEIIEKIET